MKIDNLVEIEIIRIKREDIIFSPLANNGVWCRLPYPKHKGGCPNLGSKLCPPFAPYLKDKLNYKEFQLLLAHFDFKTYKKEMKKQKPQWSDDLIKSILYWQSQIKKMLKFVIRKIPYKCLFSCGSGFNNSYSLEAIGINVFATLRKINKKLVEKGEKAIQFEIKPQNKIILCCLICSNQKLLWLQDFYKRGLENSGDVE